MVSKAGIARCGVAAVLFGISAPAASRLAGDLNAFLLAGLLYLGAALAVLPVAGRARPTRRTVRAELPRLVPAVVLGGAVGPVLLAAGLARAPAPTASLLLNLELVFTTILAGWVFREHIGAAVAGGTALVFLGTATLGWSGSPQLRWGVVFVAGACLCWAVDNCVTAVLTGLTASQITLVKGLTAGSVNTGIGLLAGSSPDSTDVLAALVIGAFGYGVSITLWVAGARELGAARGQLVFATAPFVGAVVAWTVWDDAVELRQLVAFAFAGAGVAMVLRSSHEHRHVHAATSHGHDHTDDEHHRHRHDPGVGSNRHRHVHDHEAVTHHHRHVPDVHHRHGH
jgi:drug/metabolite transporter (DMT)-like permease